MRVLIAGGGTGGHLYPGMAIAEEVVRRGGEVLFVGTPRGLEARVVPAAGYALELIEVSGLKRMGFARTLKGIGRLPLAFGKSFGIIRRWKPDVVVGVGGYASGPLVLAASLARYPTAVQEQNSVPGITNRTLGRMARVVFTAFPEAAKHFAEKKIDLTGNPVRRRFLEAVGQSAAGTGEPRLLVVGGSQGARAVNDLVLAMVEVLSRAGKLPSIVHQTGPSDADRCRGRYQEMRVGDRVTVKPFIEDMVGAYRDASVVIGRAGALTLAELAIVGRASILIPLPTSADDHQRKNAESFAAAGAALVFEQAATTGDGLAEAAGALLADGARREAMATAMRGLAKPEAAARIVDRLETLARGAA